MNVYTNNEFKGRWPVGTAAVVVAENQEQAAKLLQAVLEVEGLKQEVKPNQMFIIDTNAPNVRILNDGDY